MGISKKKKKKRSGRTVRLQIARPLIRAYLERHFVTAVVLGAVAIALVVLVPMLGGISAWYGFVAGVALSMVVASACWVVLEASGARSAVVGAMGEDFTAEELDTLDGSWRRIDSVPFGTIFDIDHVVVSERGVFAVETKFTTHPWPASSPELRRAASNARWKARKIRLLLAGSGRPDVAPVLVVWGYGATALPLEPIDIDGVIVSRGGANGALKDHLDSCEPVLNAEAVGLIADAIEQHTTRTETANTLQRV